MTVFGA